MDVSIFLASSVFPETSGGMGITIVRYVDLHRSLYLEQLRADL